MSLNSVEFYTDFAKFACTVCVQLQRYSLKGENDDKDGVCCDSELGNYQVMGLDYLLTCHDSSNHSFITLPALMHSFSVYNHTKLISIWVNLHHSYNLSTYELISSTTSSERWRREWHFTWTHVTSHSYQITSTTNCINWLISVLRKAAGYLLLRLVNLIYSAYDITFQGEYSSNLLNTGPTCPKLVL